jgi:hypothetical protein
MPGTKEVKGSIIVATAIAKVADSFQNTLIKR